MSVNLTVKKKLKTLNKLLTDLHFTFILISVKIINLFKISIIINCF